MPPRNCGALCPALLLSCFAILQTLRDNLQRATVSVAANRHDTAMGGTGDFATIDLLVDLAQKHRWEGGREAASEGHRGAGESGCGGLAQSNKWMWGSMRGKCVRGGTRLTGGKWFMVQIYDASDRRAVGNSMCVQISTLHDIDTRCGCGLGTKKP